MPPIVIDLRRTEDTRDAIHRAVQTLAEGKLVVFPTETVYGLGASARSVEGVERLFAAKQRSSASPVTLAIKSSEECLDYAPRAGIFAERLARRCWPGPVTLVVDCDAQESLIRSLPRQVRHVVAPNDTVGLRVPAHNIVLDVLRMLTGPIALTSANLSGAPDARIAAEALYDLREHVALVLDDGPCRYGQVSTVVRVTQGKVECMREGVVPHDALVRLSGMVLVLVCTGNTCRSPMGEALLRQVLAKSLKCPVDQLDQHGISIVSAGIAALPGCAASSEAVEVMKEKGLDISQHESQPLTENLMRHADQVYTMTTGHRLAILRRWPDAVNKTFTLRTDGKDISDPIGGTKQLYRQCADQIEQAIRQRMDSVDFSSQSR